MRKIGKTVKGLAEMISFLLVFAGLTVCMCETADLDKQVQIMCMGVAIIAIGTVIGFLAEGEEDVYSR